MEYSEVVQKFLQGFFWKIFKRFFQKFYQRFLKKIFHRFIENYSKGFLQEIFQKFLQKLLQKLLHQIFRNNFIKSFMIFWVFFHYNKPVMNCSLNSLMNVGNSARISFLNFSSDWSRNFHFTRKKNFQNFSEAPPSILLWTASDFFFSESLSNMHVGIPPRISSKRNESSCQGFFF